MSHGLRATTSDKQECHQGFLGRLGRKEGRREGGKEGKKKGREGKKERGRAEGRKEREEGREEAREDTCNRQLPQARHCAKGFARVLSLNHEDSPLRLVLFLF